MWLLCNDLLDSRTEERAMKKHPERLTNDVYLQSSLPFRIFHQKLFEPCELHWHEFYELTYIVAGEGVNVVNGISFPLTKGSIFLLTPADFHQISPTPESCLLYNVIFTDELLDEELRDQPGSKIIRHQLYDAGVAWYINDVASDPSGYPIEYPTDSGYVVEMLEDNGTKTTNIVHDYEHNWKESAFEPEASIDVVNLTASQLAVTYNVVNYHWLKTGVNQTIYKW